MDGRRDQAPGGLREPRGAEITDRELKEAVEEGVEVLDLNGDRNRVKPTTWYVR